MIVLFFNYNHTCSQNQHDNKLGCLTFFGSQIHLPCRPGPRSWAEDHPSQPANIGRWYIWQLPSGSSTYQDKEFCSLTLSCRCTSSWSTFRNTFLKIGPFAEIRWTWRRHRSYLRPVSRSGRQPLLLRANSVGHPFICVCSHSPWTLLINIPRNTAPLLISSTWRSDELAQRRRYTS